MGLDCMDRTEVCASGSHKFQPTLPPAQSMDDLEERRKAFWVLFILDAYASVRSGTAVAIEASKVTTALPSPPECTQSTMPSLKNAPTLYETGGIPSFTGLVLMVSLYRRCLNHIKSSLETESAGASRYSFWEHHYGIDKDLQNCSDALIGKMDPQELLDDDFALALNLNLCAIDICLHEAAIMKAEREGLPKTLSAECSNRCSQAAMRIVEGVSLTRKLAQPKKTLFRQMNIFCMWPVCMAMQVLNSQMSGTDHKDLGPTVSVLRLLATAIEDLEDPSGHWIDSISHIVRRLEEMNAISRGTTEFE